MEGKDYKNFDIVVEKLRGFFKDVKGFREVHTQNKKSILDLFLRNSSQKKICQILRKLRKFLLVF